jgi:hypothetical protein
MWEKNVGNCEVTRQALWPIAKLRMKRDGPKAPTAVHGPLGITYHPNDRANAIEDCLGKKSHLMTCVTITMRGGWRLESKFCSHL